MSPCQGESREFKSRIPLHLIPWYVSIRVLFFVENVIKRLGKGGRQVRSGNKIFKIICIAAALGMSLSAESCSLVPPEETVIVTNAQGESFRIIPPQHDENNQEVQLTAPSNELYMATENLDFTDFVFVGDSRTVGMGQYLHLTTIAEVGVGYSFLQSHYDEIMNLSGKNIVFNLGVNDLAHIDEYIEFFQRIPEDFCFDNHLYVVSVNPTSGPYSSMNGDIDYFNVQLSDSLPSTIKWIDTCSFLRDAGFGSPDGLHYNQQTYETIAELIYNDVMLYQSLGY